MEKIRLDVELASRGLARSRSAARDLITRGKVFVRGKAVLKPSHEVAPDDEISVIEPLRFVSRAGEKLDHALTVWNVDVHNAQAVDIGSSTGGFAQCLLARGAARVVAIEVGTDQLDDSLRADPRIELHEQTDVRKFTPHSPADIAVADVSFISLTLIMPKIFEFLKKGGCAVLLVKPQFEVGKEVAQKRRGVILDDAERTGALRSVEAAARNVGFEIISNTDSPIEGEGGNREFLLLVRKP